MVITYMYYIDVGDGCGAPTCELRHLMLTSAPSSIGMLTSVQYKMITYAVVRLPDRLYHMVH